MPKGFGLEVEDRSLKAFQIDKIGRKGCKFVTCGLRSMRKGIVVEGEIMDPAALAAEIKELLKITKPKPIKNKFVVLSVSDNGIGISKKDQPYMFKSFYRGHDARLAYTEGMGLGLYTAKAIVKRHHGKIWFSSKGAGKGSTFYLALRIKQ